MQRRRGLVVALVLIACLALTGCSKEEEETFLLYVVFFCFGAAASVGSMVGSCFALVHAAQRRPRNYVNFALAIPFAIAALSLHLFTTHWFHSPMRGLDRDVFWLFAMTATPLCWLAATIIGVSLAPKPVAATLEQSHYRDAVVRATPDAPPLTRKQLATAIIPPVLGVLLYMGLVYAALPVAPPRPAQVEAPNGQVPHVP